MSIYIDNAATTKISDNVLNAMMPFLTEQYGNPSSIHEYGRKAKEAIENSRATIATLLKVKPNEIFFTSGGTEANNWAIKGAISKDKNHVITTNIEHHSVLNSCEALMENNCEITYLPVNKDGIILPEQVENALRKETALVSIMYANNEIGTIQPIKEIGDICKKHGVIFHTDAVQAIGNVDIDLDDCNIDLMSISGHKFHAPKGIGILYIKNGVKLQSLIHGGLQEKNRRSGTENVAGIVAIAQALQDKMYNIQSKQLKIKHMRDYLCSKIIANIPEININGSMEKRLSGNLNISFNTVEGESLVLCLGMEGIYVSSGAACSSGSLSPSHVLMAIGLNDDMAHSSIRISLDDDITIEDIDYVFDKLVKTVMRLRSMSHCHT